ncbi:MAG: GAF domain-containing protein [Nitrospirota bacterium]|nr:GAF domain-containing protein [Nitrospirota bacterium]
MLEETGINAVLDRIFFITERVVALDSIDDIFDHVVRTAVQITNSEAGTIRMFDHGTGLLKIVKGYGVSTGFLSQPAVRIGEGIAGRVVLQGRPYATVNITKTPYSVNKEFARPEGIKSLMSVPLKSRGVTLGCITVCRKKADGFSEQELIMLSIFSAQAAEAMEKMQLIVSVCSEKRITPCMLPSERERTVSCPAAPVRDNRPLQRSLHVAWREPPAETTAGGSVSDDGSGPCVHSGLSRLLTARTAAELSTLSAHRTHGGLGPALSELVGGLGCLDTCLFLRQSGAALLEHGEYPCLHLCELLGCDLPSALVVHHGRASSSGPLLCRSGSRKHDHQQRTTDNHNKISHDSFLLAYRKCSDPLKYMTR